MPSSEEYCDDTDSTIQDQIKSKKGSEFLGQDPAGEIISQLKEKFHLVVRNLLYCPIARV